MSPIERAVRTLGSQTALARALGVSDMAVTQWKRRGVPATRCNAIEAATGGQVTRHDLRPDLFDPPPKPTPVFLPDRRRRDDPSYAGPERRGGSGDAPAGAVADRGLNTAGD